MSEDSEFEVSPDEIMGSMGMSEDVQAPAEEASELPDYVKSRLGREKKKHSREIQQLRQEMEQMKANMPQNHFDSPGQPSPGPQAGAYGGDHSEMIRQEVARHLAEQKQHESMQHMNDQVQRMHHDLMKAGEKYDDFDDVVFGDTPFTPAVRDVALILPAETRAEVLYKLGKNPDELRRLNKLHPLEIYQEVIKLSHAVTGGHGKDSAPKNHVNSLQQMKTNPSVGSSEISEKTSVADLRNRFKNSGWGRR